MFEDVRRFLPLGLIWFHKSISFVYAYGAPRAGKPVYAFGYGNELMS